jgi:hypothetical protein
MKKTLLFIFTMTGLLCAPLFANVYERADFILFLDAGVPLKGAEGRYGADFGRSFLGLGLQARLAGNFHLEAGCHFYPKPDPHDIYLYNTDGFELTLDGVWKMAAGKSIVPFVKVGASYAWISANNSYMEQYYPDAGRQTDRWLGLNAGAGIECRLGEKLLLRLGGAFTLVPNDGEGAAASWGKLAAGLGLSI